MFTPELTVAKAETVFGVATAGIQLKPVVCGPFKVQVPGQQLHWLRRPSAGSAVAQGITENSPKLANQVDSRLACFALCFNASLNGQKQTNKHSCGNGKRDLKDLPAQSA